MPLIGSTITDLDQLRHYSSDSEITTQKDFWGDGISLVVLDSWLSRGLYAIRARLKPEKTKAEDLAALNKVKELITNEYQNYQGMGYEENFAISVSDKAFPKSPNPDEKKETSSLTVKSLRSTIGSAFLKARAEAEEKKRDEIIARFKEEPDKALARIFYNSLFERPSGYRMPNQYQETAHNNLVTKTRNFANENSLKLSDVTDSIQHHVDAHLTPQRREINSTILDGILEREKITREYSDHEWAKDIYDEMFLKLDGTYKKLTPEDLSGYETTASETIFEERLACIGQSNNPREFLTLLTDISSLPSQEEKTRLQTELLNAVGISENNRPPSPPSVVSDSKARALARQPLFSEPSKTDPRPQSPKSVTDSIAEEKTRLPLFPETSIFTLVQRFGEICAQIDSTPKESSSFSDVREKLISNQADAQESLSFNKELDEKVKTILKAIVAYEPPPPPSDCIIGDLVEDGTVLEDSTTLV